MTLKQQLAAVSIMVVIMFGLAFAWYQYTEDKITNEIQNVATTTEIAEIVNFSKPVADNSTETSLGLSFLQRGNKVTLMNKEVNISLDLPEGWRIEAAEPPQNDSAYLLTNAGIKAAKITCPIPATGGPYEHSPTSPVLERTLIKGGVVYEASFSELAENLFEDRTDQDGNRSSHYIGPGTKTSYVQSRVSPVDTAANPDMGCLLYQYGPTEEEIDLLRTVYYSWK